MAEDEGEGEAEDAPVIESSSKGVDGGEAKSTKERYLHWLQVSHSKRIASA